MNFIENYWIHRTKSAAAVVAVALLTLSQPAWADINYTFIHMDCDPSSQTAKIKVFYDSNEAGKARAERPEKDTYYMDDIVTNPEKPTSGTGIDLSKRTAKEVTCRLGDQIVVSFHAAMNPAKHADDNVDMYLNKHRIAGWDSWTRPSEFTIKVTAPDEAQVKRCPLGPDDYTPSNKNCENSHVVNGTKVSQ